MIVHYSMSGFPENVERLSLEMHLFRLIGADLHVQEGRCLLHKANQYSLELATTFKMKIHLSILIILIFCFSEQKLLGQELTPFESNEFYGYKNELGKVNIEPQYQYAMKFVENYAVIIKNDSLGIIDKQNNLIIPPKFNYLKYIGNDKFIFGFYAKYFGEYNLGVITSENKIILEPKYYNIRPKSNFFIVTKQSYKTIDSSEIYDTRETTNKYGVVDSLGNVILEPDFSRIDFLSNDFVIAKKELNSNFALFNAEYKQLTEFKYMIIGEFYDGLSKVREGDCFGYINTKGEEVIKCEYDLNYIFIDSLAIARKNGKAGIINTKNEVILEFKYQGLGIPFQEQLAAYDSLKWGIVNLKGKTLLNFDYDNILSEFKGILAVEKSNKWQVWDYENIKLLTQRYDELKLIEGDENKVLGFGKIKPKKYSQSIVFARINEKWGIINDKGITLIPIEFEMKDLYEKLKTL